MARGNELTRTKATPLAIQRTRRPTSHRVLTSMPAGKMVPLAVIPLLREDELKRTVFRVAVEMEETVEVLMNAVNIRVRAYMVPNLAKARFQGSLDILNKSYAGKPLTEGGDPVPWFEEIDAPAHGENAILTYLGAHFRAGTKINTDFIEGYNILWNFLAKNRSPDIPMRDRLDDTLAPAFWLHQTFAHIVPDFDQALIDGEVPLNIVDGQLVVSGPAQSVTGAVMTDGQYHDASTNVPIGMWTGTSPVYVAASNAGGSFGKVHGTVTGGTVTLTDVFAEMAANGITISLSNIEMAKKTAAFAQLRRQYNGHSDEYIIDLLMSGISMPEQVWKQPVKLFDGSTIFGMNKRYASDSGNLTDSVVNGATMIDVPISCPRCPTGGVIFIVAEVTPEQLFERQRDPYLHALDVAELPEFVRDHLDPEPVRIVKNEEVDIDHDTPNGTFGYAPLNSQWMQQAPKVGGRYYRPEVDASFDEDRQAIWAVETKNPVLSADFYLCTTMHYKPFVVTDPDFDHFKVLLRGEGQISGNTQFGGLLIESTNDYDKIVEKQPNDRIEKDA